MRPSLCHSRQSAGSCLLCAFLTFTSAVTVLYLYEATTGTSLLLQNGYDRPSRALSSTCRDTLTTIRPTVEGSRLGKVFNFGELVRGKGGQEEEMAEVVSPEEMERLKQANRCPKYYTLPDSLVERYKDLRYLTNLTVAQNTSSQYYSQVNVSRINEILASQPEVVILTPISNVVDNLRHYFSLLCSLSYPHTHISVAIGEDSSTDRSLELASAHARTLRAYFRRVEVWHFSDAIPRQSHFGKHDEFFQLTRRGHLAAARNQLLSRGLGDAEYALWVDADVKYFPPDVVQMLLSADVDVIVPACMFWPPQAPIQVYDRNSWQETVRSRDFLSRQSPDFLKLEGYTQSMRLLLADISPGGQGVGQGVGQGAGHGGGQEGQGPLVALDGVGGCVLLIKAQCHRKGLIFPPFVFDHHIETEGLAKMAHAMGYGVYGYPRMYVFHF